MRARLSILGLFRYDSGVFDLLELPSGVDHDTVVYRILRRAAEFEILFPDWDYMRYAIGCWSRERLEVWNRLYATTQLDYDPIANYDRREQWKDSGSSTTSGSSSDTEHGTASATTEQATAGFNTDNPKTHDVSDTDSTANRTASGTRNGAESSASEHEGRVWGNIGVTSTQQLITQEREVSGFNIVEFIADDFEREFCLLVY